MNLPVLPNQWASRAFLSKAQRELFARGIPVFVLHKTAMPPRDTRDPFDYVRPEVLEEKILSLLEASLEPLTLAALTEEALGKGFILTFDDAYVNILENAAPILARHKIRATTFVVAGRMGGHNEWDVARGEKHERLMDQVQVRQWLAAGHEIGSHTLTHPNLKTVSRARAREEIFASKKLLEDTFGVAVSHFCYPSGKFDGNIQDMVREAGYKTASTVLPGINLPGQNLFELRRFSPLYAKELFAKAIHRIWHNPRRPATARPG